MPPNSTQWGEVAVRRHKMVYQVCLLFSFPIFSLSLSTQQVSITDIVLNKTATNLTSPNEQNINKTYALSRHNYQHTHTVSTSMKEQLTITILIVISCI